MSDAQDSNDGPEEHPGLTIVTTLDFDGLYIVRRLIRLIKIPHMANTWIDLIGVIYLH